MLSCSVVSDSVTPGTVVHQLPVSMEFSRQEHWSGSPFPPPGDLLDPGIKPGSLATPALAGRFFSTLPPGKHESLYLPSSPVLAILLVMGPHFE